jgi:hypothetical protein
MIRRMCSPSVRAPAAIVLAVVMIACVAASADAKLKDHGRWVFRGTDYNEDASERNDPMTILYKGGRNPYTGSRRETTNAVESMADDWEDGDLHPQACNSNKTLVYRLFPGRWLDETDLNMSTSGSCKNQWHTRIWNDREINPGGAQWEVGGIHREIKRYTHGQFGHRLNMSFEQAEHEALQYMSKYCSRPNWRALPGSGPEAFERSYGTFYSNGKISRISMKPVDHSQPSGSKCRGAWR